MCSGFYCFLFPMAWLFLLYVSLENCKKLLCIFRSPRCWNLYLDRVINDVKMRMGRHTLGGMRSFVDIWDLFVERQNISIWINLALVGEARRRGWLQRGCTKLKAAFGRIRRDHDEERRRGWRNEIRKGVQNAVRFPEIVKLEARVGLLCMFGRIWRYRREM